MRRPEYPVPTSGGTKSQTMVGNTSIFSSSEESQHSMPYLVLVGSTFGLLVVVAVTGNVLVVAAVFKDERLRHNLHNYFIVSLAVADMLVSLAVMPAAAVNDFYGWVFLPGYCTIWISTDVMGCTASILNLCTIAFVRYKTIQDPLQCAFWLTPRMVGGLIATVWLLSFIISFIPIQLDWHVPSQSESNPVPPSDGNVSADDAFICFIDFSPAYGIISSMISFYIPAAFMLYFYTMLLNTAHKHVRMLKKVTLADRPTVQVTFTGDSSSKRFSNRGDRRSTLSSRLMNNLSKPQVSTDYKAICTLGIVVGSFLACWLPFFIVNTVASICKTCISNVAFQVCTWLGYSSSCFNPIIYSVFNREFRKVFWRLIMPDCMRWHCIGNREESLTVVYPTIATFTRSRAAGSVHNTSESHTTSRLHSFQSSVKVPVPSVQHLPISDERKDCVEASKGEDQNKKAVPHEDQDNATVPNKRKDTMTVPHEGQDNVTVSHEIQDNMNAAPHEGQDNTTVSHEGQGNTTVPQEGQDITTLPHGGQGNTTLPHGQGNMTLPYDGQDNTTVPQ